MSESRTISVDPGLLSPEELLSRHEGGRRKSLEGLIEKQQTVFNDGKPIHLLCRQHMRWFLDSARLKISVSPLKIGSCFPDFKLETYLTFSFSV
jgi:hypothetical protein